MTRCRNILLHAGMGVLGGLAYMGIEILWRGHTHWTMGVVGGLCFVLIGLLDEWQEHPPLLIQMMQGAIIVTAVELIAGLMINCWLGLGVWDYSHLPLHLMGQICPQFTALWWGLCLLFIPVFDWLRWAVEGGERPYYTIV